MPTPALTLRQSRVRDIWGERKKVRNEKTNLLFPHPGGLTPTGPPTIDRE